MGRTSLIQIRNAVLLFSNPVWDGDKTVPSTIVRNISALSSQIGYQERIVTNLTTLTTSALKLDGTFGGLLFPQITASPSCNLQQYDFIPRGVTRRENLPPTNINVVAIAPWFSIECTRTYLVSAARSSLHALIFYKPNNSTNKPQEVDSPVWNLDDDDTWRKNHFPIFAVPGLDGQKLMRQLSLYSGTLDEVPHGQEISQLYGPNADYVRIWTDLTMQSASNVPAVWALVLIVVGALLSVITAVSLIMHLIQRRNRTSLERRVQSGEVDLEAMGIKRLTVWPPHVKRFPLFTYNAEPDPTKLAPASPAGSVPPGPKKSPKARRSDQRAAAASDTSCPNSSRSIWSIRSKRSSAGGPADTTATNFQPDCHICLISFEHCKTVIRELSCGHIFHPACIDEFLTHVSSLCPICNQCMLPRGYSPKITNAMVRREQAVSRLRGRVDLETSVEESETKLMEWGKRLFGSSTPAPAHASNLPEGRPPLSQTASEAGPEQDAMAIQVAGTASPAAHAPDTPKSCVSKSTAPRPPKPRPRALTLLPTHQEEAEIKETTTVGRSSPSSFSRERMRQMAAKNAPFEDADRQRPKWRRT